MALFERSTKGVQQTLQGELLIGYGRCRVAIHDKALPGLGGDAAAGVVRIGVMDHCAIHVRSVRRP